MSHIIETMLVSGAKDITFISKFISTLSSGYIPVYLAFKFRCLESCFVMLGPLVRQAPLKFFLNFL